MTIGALDAEGLITHSLAAIGQRPRLVARAALELRVEFIEGEARVFLMIEDELAEARHGLVAILAPTRPTPVELTGVLVVVAGVAARSRGTAEGQRFRDDVAVLAIRLGMSPVEREARPEFMFERLAWTSTEGLLIVAAYAALSPAEGTQSGIAIEASRMHILVASRAAPDSVADNSNGRAKDTAAYIGFPPRDVAGLATRSCVRAFELELRVPSVVEERSVQVIEAR